MRHIVIYFLLCFLSSSSVVFAKKTPGSVLVKMPKDIKYKELWTKSGYLHLAIINLGKKDWFFFPLGFIFKHAKKPSIFVNAKHLCVWDGAQWILSKNGKVIRRESKYILALPITSIEKRYQHDVFFNDSINYKMSLYKLSKKELKKALKGRAFSSFR